MTAKQPFVHLRVRSPYSLLEGAIAFHVASMSDPFDLCDDSDDVDDAEVQQGVPEIIEEAER